MLSKRGAGKQPASPADDRQQVKRDREPVNESVFQLFRQPESHPCRACFKPEQRPERAIHGAAGAVAVDTTALDETAARSLADCAGGALNVSQLVPSKR